MPKSSIELIRKVADYCWSNKFLGNIFHKFFNDHAEMFADAPALMEDGENDLEFYSLFQKYLLVYEDTLTDYLLTLDVSIEDFYSDLREVQTETEDPYLLTFIECLLASCDYKSFYRVMAKEGKKRKPVNKIASPKAESKAESKFASDKKDIDDLKKSDKASYK